MKYSFYHINKAARGLFIISLFGVIALGLAVTNMPAAHAAPSTKQGSCQNVRISVSTGSGQASLYGEFCMPSWIRPTTVQLLVHGATYNHTYWDFPGFDGKYSYVDVANRGGYATLAIDRLGTGQSTHPASSQVTYQAQISTLHQVVQALRSGTLGMAFSHVEYIGHSFGSAYGVGEVSTYHDVDALMLTGYGHKVSTITQQQSSTFFHAANLEPRFSTPDYSGYITTIPGLRGQGGLFYDPTLANPTVITADEATKDVASTTEFATRPPDLGTLTPNIHVPVLIIDGQEDTHYCSAGANDCTSSKTFLKDEAPFFNTCLSTELVQSGHDINLHVTARSSYRAFLRWSYATLPPIALKARCALPGAL